MVTNLASPTELNRRSAIKVVKQQISDTFNTKPKEKEQKNKEEIAKKQSNLTELKPLESRNQIIEVKTPQVKSEPQFGSGIQTSGIMTVTCTSAFDSDTASNLKETPRGRQG